MQPAYQKNVNTVRLQRGFILITVLLLLGILSLSAYLAIERSQFSLKTNHNRQIYMQAQHHAEESRLTALPLLQAMLKSPQNSLPKIPGVQYDAVTDILSPQSFQTQNRSQKIALIPFLKVERAPIKGEVSLLPLPAQLNTGGVALNQHMAYQGVGQGLGAAGSVLRFFEVRARGIVDIRGTEVSYWTASDYRFVP
jgi:type II secretory pathway pseudopilin PulG